MSRRKNDKSTRAWLAALAMAGVGCGSAGGSPASAGDAGEPGRDGAADARGPGRPSSDSGAPEGSKEASTRPASTSAEVRKDGAFTISFPGLDWTFAGSVGAPATDIHESAGKDGMGAYTEVTFSFGTKTGAVRVYVDLGVALLTETYGSAETNDAAPFPTFTRYPRLPYHVTYGDTEFAPVSFDALTPDSPFVYFDDHADAFILSAASDFMNAATAVTAAGALASGIDPAVPSLPAGFSHRTVLVAGRGIGAAYARWGQVLTALSGKKRVANDARPYLERFGYWTDNGAAYYYNYDAARGYPGTLEDVSAYFSSLGVPLAYMQLDSWFYPKGPGQSWTDKADGQYVYAADATLFPSGLSSFHASLGLPLVTHARWIDPSSPYRSEYATSNNVATDPGYWSMVASYLAASGVTVYEQDWLNQNALPVTTNLTDQAAFMDGMADAMQKQGIDMQYCMPLPRHYLQGSLYANLTTTRVSVDRFSSPRYVDFLYVSLLTSSLGAWPWTDTFNSPETDNLLLSTLSAGMVGVGDEKGSASVKNLLQAVRSDGVIVKPDVPIVPLDATFLDQAKGTDAPLVAATYTDFGDLRASYVYAFSVGANLTARFTPKDLGYGGKVYVFDDFQGIGTLVDARVAYEGPLHGGSAYYVLAPVGPSGMAFLGDAGKFVSLGKKRFSRVTDHGMLAMDLQFASGETTVTLHGYAPSAPKANASIGTVGPVSWDAPTGLFSLSVSPSGNTASLTLSE